MTEVAPAPVVETFMSCLDIPLSDDESSAATTGIAQQSQPNAQLYVASSSTRHVPLKNRTGAAPSRMNARASKTNALAAMANTQQALIDSIMQDESNTLLNPTAEQVKLQLQQELASSQQNGAAPARNPIRKGMIAPKAPPLDFSTLRTSAPRQPNPMPRPRFRPSRIFGLQQAPTYHPTVEEFADPMKYIQSIAPQAKEYGICKVVPPEGWRPPFALNTEASNPTFRFKTRLQQLNSMEASARASLNFLEQLYLFHRQHGHRNVSIPTVAGKPIDMWRLKREVAHHGGHVKVTNDRKWSTISRTLGYEMMTNTTICSQVKAAYMRLILPFEDYVKKAKKEGNSNAVAYDSFQKPEDEVENDVESARTATQKKAENARAVEEGKLASNKIASSLPGESEQRTDALGELLPGEVCEICTFDHNPEKIVLCDGCDRGYHLDCLTPKLTEVPTSQFFCDNCLFFNGADYGFEEGDNHSLHSFRRRADAFKRRWLQDHPMPERAMQRIEKEVASAEDEIEQQVAIEDHFEREFWRLVESPNETVEVEYGADVNATKDACGFPDLEVHMQDPYSRDGWNLNNLPVLAGSLLRYIRSDISGMTIPWIYVGMVFSTFAWHKEDHYTYSINYHHWGDTKTWYGVPGADDEILEAAMKQAAPELFEQQPDLLFQLVTLMSPGRLKQHGCRVYALDQRPNEFIITFPRAYHSGFNHGFNFNEAVNFALPDWLPNGLRCVNRYREIKKNPVFSHDELIVTILNWDKNPDTPQWILPSVKEMVERELASRQKVRRFMPKTKEIVDATDLNEEEYQCTHCRALCFLGRICEKNDRDIACFDCWDVLPQDGEYVFKFKFSDREMRGMHDKIKNKLIKMGVTPIEQQSTKRKMTAESRAAIGLRTSEEQPAQRIKVDEDTAELPAVVSTVQIPPAVDAQESTTQVVQETSTAQDDMLKPQTTSLTVDAATA
ncbi:hypothetical protein OIV83_001741 [Microbotryomycetes sp. JL201]|nr:hypothetical protein OIV83_001741 [Microbotryomycetes sp. JL201]